MNRTPEQIIEHWILNSVQYNINDDGILEVRGSAGAGARIIRALEHAGYQIVSQPGPRGIETR